MNRHSTTDRMNRVVRHRHKMWQRPAEDTGRPIAATAIVSRTPLKRHR